MHLQVKFMAESALEESPSSPAPTDPDYVGCFSDTVGDRLLFTVEIDQALTPEVGEGNARSRMT